MPLLADLLREMKGNPALVRALQGAAGGLEREVALEAPALYAITVPAWEEVAPSSGGEQFMTASGLKPGDFVAVAKPTMQAGLGLGGARVSAQDTIAVTWLNSSLAALRPSPGEVYSVLHVPASADRRALGALITGSLAVGAEAPID